MKVALIHIRYIYKGGLETRLFNYIDYFLNRGDEVHLFTSKIAPDIRPPENLHIHLVDLKKVLKPVRNFFFNKRLKKMLDGNDFDFILSLERTSRQYHVIAPSTHKGYLVAKKSWFYDFIDWLQIYLDKKAFRNAEVVFACSEMIKKEIEIYYRIPSKNIKVLYPPINVQKFNTNLDKQEARAMFDLKPNRKYFLLVSTSHKRKGLDVLLEVFKDLPMDYQLLVAGTEFSTNIPNVKSMGFVKDIEYLYRAVDVLLHPATYEPFGQIITEAFASQVPVIVSDKVGAKELVNDSNGVVVNGLEPADWKSVLINLDLESFSFEGVEEMLADLALQNHMNKMLNWAILKK